MSVLVTGASGFVGSHLARRLLNDGEQVNVIVRPESDLALLDGVRERLAFHVHDGTTEGMLAVVESVAPDLVFHLASLFISQHGSGDVEPLIQSNVLFGAQLAEAMSVRGVGNLVNVGTSWQNYENRDYSPVCLYAATKQSFEALLQFYVETERLRATTLRFFDTYGPEDPRPKLLSLLRRIADSGESLEMSPGDQLQDLVYVDDVIDALMLAGEKLRRGEIGAEMEVFAVSSGRPIPLRDLVSAFAAAYGRPLNIRWGGRPYREREVMIPWSQGAPLPGWKPRVPLAEGLRRMLDDRV